VTTKATRHASKVPSGRRRDFVRIAHVDETAGVQCGDGGVDVIASDGEGDQSRGVTEVHGHERAGRGI
jgi:hypothetical protein